MAAYPGYEITVVCPGESLPSHFDALVIAGGADISPTRYRTSARVSNLTYTRGRDEQDFALFERSQRIGAAALGICRGAQVVNVALGGSLWQDLPQERSSEVAHNFDRLRGFPPDHAAHALLPCFGAERCGALGSLFGASFTVNSRHHQAVRRLGARLIPLATAPDGLVEAFGRQGGSFCCGIQWHPEDLLAEPVQRTIFALFIESAVLRRRSLSLPRRAAMWQAA